MLVSRFSFIKMLSLAAIIGFTGTGSTYTYAQAMAQNESATVIQPAPQPNKVMITEGTTVRVRLLEKLDTGTNMNVGEQIHFEVADPVIINGTTVIRPGARATGTITEATKAKWGGRKGKLDFTIDYVEAIDGQNVRVRSTSAKVKGRGNVGLMAAGVLLVSPVAVFVRGKNAVVEKGTEFSIYIDQDREISAQ